MRALLHLELIQLRLLRIGLRVLLALGHLELRTLRVELQALGVGLGLLLELGLLELHARIHDSLRLRHLLHQGLSLLDDGRQCREHVDGAPGDHLRCLGQHGVVGALLFGILDLLEHVADVHAGGLVAHLEHAHDVPHRDVFLDVVQDRRDERRRDERVHAQRR